MASLPNLLLALVSTGECSFSDTGWYCPLVSSGLLTVCEAATAAALGLACFASGLQWWLQFALLLSTLVLYRVLSKEIGVRG